MFSSPIFINAEQLKSVCHILISLYFKSKSGAYPARTKNKYFYILPINERLVRLSAFKLNSLEKDETIDLEQLIQLLRSIIIDCFY